MSQRRAWEAPYSGAPDGRTPATATPETACGTPDCPCGDATLCGTRTAYVYAWGNNERRAALKGRPCVVVASGRMSTVLIEMLDTGERVTTSRRAIRRTA